MGPMALSGGSCSRPEVLGFHSQLNNYILIPSSISQLLMQFTCACPSKSISHCQISTSGLTLHTDVLGPPATSAHQMGTDLAQSHSTRTSHIAQSMPLYSLWTHWIDCRTSPAAPLPSGCAPGESDCVPPTQQGRPVAAQCLYPCPLHTHLAHPGGLPPQTGTNRRRTMLLMSQKAMEVGIQPSPSQSTRLSPPILGLLSSLRC